MTDCTYCGCEVEAHDPVAVYETGDAPDGVAPDGTDAGGDEPGVLAGEFCNWGCLAAHAQESDVATGTTCNWTPDA